MSTTTREPLLSDQMLKNARCLLHDCLWIRGVYEAARAKDAELIQQLVDALHAVDMEGPCFPFMTDALNAAAAAGFKPTEP